MRTLGLNLDHLDPYPDKKVLMLKQLPQHKADPDYSLLTNDEVALLFEETIKSEKIAAFAREALDSGKLEVFYQPIVQSEHAGKVYVEALVRAPSNEGYINANDFIDYLAHQQKMEELDLFVIKEIESQIEDLKHAVSKLSINIYPDSFQSQEVIAAHAGLDLGA